MSCKCEEQYVFDLLPCIYFTCDNLKYHVWSNNLWSIYIFTYTVANIWDSNISWLLTTTITVKHGYIFTCLILFALVGKYTDKNLKTVVYTGTVPFYNTLILLYSTFQVRMKQKYYQIFWSTIFAMEQTNIYLWSSLDLKMTSVITAFSVYYIKPLCHNAFDHLQSESYN